MIRFVSLCLVLSMMPSVPLRAEQTLPLKTQIPGLPMEDGHYSIKSPCVEKPIAVLPGVYLGAWADTATLCSALTVKPGADVLDIGTGNGILAITALERGARFAVATDINPRAVENARLNAKLRNLGRKLDARLVPKNEPGAFSVIKENEHFDLIICNCPAFDAPVETYDEANAFDPGHMLVISLFKGLRAHLKPEGKLLMTYWSGGGLGLLKKLADESNLQLTILETSFDKNSIPRDLQAINRRELYKIPADKIRDVVTGQEATLIVEVIPRP